MSLELCPSFLVMNASYFSKGLVTLCFLISNTTIFSQNLNPTIPTVASLNSYGSASQTHQNRQANPFSSFTSNERRQSQQMAMHEADAKNVAKAEEMKRQAYADFEALNAIPNYTLPTFENSKGAQYYRTAYAQLLPMQHNSFSAKKATFIVENAYYEEEKDYTEFEETVKKTGEFLREKIRDFGLDETSNLAKNYTLFQFFADTLKIESKDLEHLPFSYDFDDYMGKDDWSKMFVHKLLLTGKGQCNSLPKLYLILAEEINAIAHLALSPNHSYIKFPDDKNVWHNVELTNGMLTSDAFILQSGYIKAEAIQNKIYMHPLNEKGLLSNFFSELASGYIHKYGYDDFADEIIDTALEIDPNNIGGQLLSANLQTQRLQYALKRLNIGEENFGRINQYPEVVQMYKSMMAQYETVDKLGYAEMPEEVYEKWLSSMKEMQTQDLNQSFRFTTKNQNKD